MLIDILLNSKINLLLDENKYTINKICNNGADFPTLINDGKVLNFEGLLGLLNTFCHTNCNYMINNDIRTKEIIESPLKFFFDNRDQIDCLTLYYFLNFPNHLLIRRTCFENYSIVDDFDILLIDLFSCHSDILNDYSKKYKFKKNEIEMSRLFLYGIFNYDFSNTNTGIASLILNNLRQFFINKLFINHKLNYDVIPKIVFDVMNLTTYEKFKHFTEHYDYMMKVKRGNVEVVYQNKIIPIEFIYNNRSYIMKYRDYNVENFKINNNESTIENMGDYYIELDDTNYPILTISYDRNLEPFRINIKNPTVYLDKLDFCSNYKFDCVGKRTFRMQTKFFHTINCERYKYNIPSYNESGKLFPHESEDVTLELIKINNMTSPLTSYLYKYFYEVFLNSNSLKNILLCNDNELEFLKYRQDFLNLFFNTIENNSKVILYNKKYEIVLLKSYKINRFILDHDLAIDMECENIGLDVNVVISIVNDDSLTDGLTKNLIEDKKYLIHKSNNIVVDCKNVNKYNKLRIEFNLNGKTFDFIEFNYKYK